MKILIYLSFAIILVAGCGKKDADEAGQSKEQPPSPQNTVWLTTEQQQTAGLKVEAPQPAKITPEIKGFGRVVDPAALAGMVGDFTTAQAANEASQAALKRLKTLSAQNNASEKALQEAEAAATRDQAQAQAARLKLLGIWGEAIAGRQDLSTFMESLGKMESALVRIDIPAGETLKATPEKA